MRRAVLALVVVGGGTERRQRARQVRNPATGELQYTSLTPADERKLGQAGAPQGAAPVRRRL